MQYSVIENLLKEKIGLDPESIGSSSISRVIHRRSVDSGHEDIEEYLKVLMSSEEEMRALIEAIVVPETWFFRDGKPFMLLHDYIRKHWMCLPITLPIHPMKITRVKLLIFRRLILPMQMVFTGGLAQSLTVLPESKINI